MPIELQPVTTLSMNGLETTCIPLRLICFHDGPLISLGLGGDDKMGLTNPLKILFNLKLYARLKQDSYRLLMETQPNTPTTLNVALFLNWK